MSSIFNKQTYNEIIGRLDQLTPDAKRQWGKMSPAQMLEHCVRTLEIAAGQQPAQQSFLGATIWIIKGEPDFATTKAKLRALTMEFHERGAEKGNIPGILGRLTSAEWGITQYKHLDRHLRQFGV